MNKIIMIVIVLVLLAVEVDSDSKQYFTINKVVVIGVACSSNIKSVNK